MGLNLKKKKQLIIYHTQRAPEAGGPHFLWVPPQTECIIPKENTHKLAHSHNPTIRAGTCTHHTHTSCHPRSDLVV